KPQIIKNYSKGNYEASLNLMYKSAKFSFFAMFILTLPFLFNIDFVMNFWLKEVPIYAISFIKLALIYSLIETISNPMVTGAQATGKIKIYQIVVGSFIFLTLPTVWLVFKLTNDPLNMYYVLIGNSIIALIIRIGFLIKMMNFNIYTFIKDVIFKILFVV